MTRVEAAELLERFAVDVERIRGISRTNPEQFEDKSEVVGSMRAAARALRTVPTERKPLPTLRPGAITVATGLDAVVRERRVAVEVRGRRRA